MNATPTKSPGHNFKWLVSQPSLWIAFVLWTLISVAYMALCHGPHGHAALNLPASDLKEAAIGQVIGSWIALLFLILECGLIFLITKRRPWPNLAERAPQHNTARRETIALVIYAAVILVVGRIVGLHFFGEGIAMHLNGSLVGATRVQSPVEVTTWAAWNFTFFALIPYVVFRMRGYSNQQMNLKSANWKSDLLVVLIVMAIGCAFDIRAFLPLTTHQKVAGGLLSFILHLAGTDLPIMIFIYAILLPRYARIFSPATAFLIGAASYPAMHIFEPFTRYDSFQHSLVSAIFVFLFFFPPGIMKSFLTFRTGNAWVHMWGFHAIDPHVTVDTRLIVRDFNIS